MPREKLLEDLPSYATPVSRLLPKTRLSMEPAARNKGSLWPDPESVANEPVVVLQHFRTSRSG